MDSFNMMIRNLQGTNGLPPLASMPDSKEVLSNFFNTIARLATDQSLMVSRRTVKLIDTIDCSEMHDGISPCSLPAFDRDAIAKAVKENWYIVIPPMKAGVLRINKRRYLLFKIDRLDVGMQGYTVAIHDYVDGDFKGNRGWMLNSVFVAGVLYG